MNRSWLRPFVVFAVADTAVAGLFLAGRAIILELSRLFVVVVH